MRSLRDTAFALDAPAGAAWSLRKSATAPIWPAVSMSTPGTVSVRALVGRFGAAGTALRGFANGTKNAWKHINRQQVVAEIRDRLRDPAIMHQDPTGLCGPLSILMELVRRDPARYVLVAKELLETGRFTCPTGRTIEAEDELREEPVAVGLIGQVDWLLAATMRDDANIWEDVDDDANGLESITIWTEMRDWTRDVLGLPNGGWVTCFTSGEVDVMRMVRNAATIGGVGFFCIDSALLKNGGSDDEEEAWWRHSAHYAGQTPEPFSAKVHSADDDSLWPDHWIVYLGGLNLSGEPADNDPLNFRVWSWGREYEVSCTVEAFSEYLYAGATGVH